MHDAISSTKKYSRKDVYPRSHELMRAERMMKELLAKNLIALFFLLPAAQGVQTHATPDRDETRQAQVEENARIHDIAKAVKDIAENSHALEELLLGIEDAQKVQWYMLTADKLPSQPVAVIDLMAAADVDPDCMCPRQFPESESRSVIDAWMRRSIAALNSFRMHDPRKENVRKECLGNIMKARDRMISAPGSTLSDPAEPFRRIRASCKALNGQRDEQTLSRKVIRNLQWKTPVTVSRHRPPDAGGRVYGRPL
jgi:hypothetical protein